MIEGARLDRDVRRDRGDERPAIRGRRRRKRDADRRRRRNGARPRSAARVVDVDYGSWDGVLRARAPEIVPDFGAASVIGELSYLGGVDCPVGLVRVRAWFYSEGGR